MLTKPIAPPSYQFPLGWHAILRDFTLDILTVEYLYGEVLASVGVDRTQAHPRLRALLISEAPRALNEEASNVLNQIQKRINERARATCSICGKPASGNTVSHCGEHSDIQFVPFAELKPMANPAWRLADFHMLIEGCTHEDVLRTMAGNQRQMDTATSFVKIYDAPEVSQLLAQAHSMRAAWALEDIPRR